MPTASDQPIIALKDVSKRYQRLPDRTLKGALTALLRRDGQEESFYALKDMNLEMYPGETLGIVGLNGSGKSTVLRLIAGITRPTAGTVAVYGRVSPLIELGAGFHADFSGRDNVLINASILGLTNAETRERFESIVEFAELGDFIDMPVKRYSSGMYTRLGFAIAIHVEPEILLVDEILAVGDVAFQDKCLGKMREFQERGVTIVLVSHVGRLIEDFCHRALLLDHGRIAAEGSPREVLERYATQAHAGP